MKADEEVRMGVSGFVAEGFEPVQRAFEESFASNGEVGAAFAATLDGRPVVDLWGGAADPLANAAWREDTLQVVFSGTKGFVALCMLMLVERGQLDLDQPVGRYWPEFRAAGKDGVLVRHVVSHEAGLPGFREPVSHEDLVDDHGMADLLAGQAPFWPPGEHVCYHAVTYGWLCGELVRRVDGRSIGTFFAEEVAGPLGLELWIGLPEEHESRVSVLTGSLAPPPDPVEGFEEAAQLVARNPPLFEGMPVCWNSRAYHAAEIPGAGAIGTARSIARLYGCLACGGELDRVRLLDPETIELGRTCLSSGTDACFGWPLVFGVGFALQNDERDFGPRDGAFGHCGAGGSAHGAWPDARVGFSYAMNELRDDMSRSGTLLAALDEALAAAGR
jgi:CubicO group peptidase (beta-lactamase class C family)